MRFERYPNVTTWPPHRFEVTWWGWNCTVWRSSYTGGRLAIELGPLAIYIGRLNDQAS